jgi:hypothetical protein
MACPVSDRPQEEAGRVLRDLKTLARFIVIYCHGNHEGAERCPVVLPGFDVQEIAGQPVELCRECRKLLQHALIKRSHCPMSPKPMCKHCPKHCYAPHYRDQIRDVMKYAGPKLVMRGRLDYLIHLFF